MTTQTLTLTAFLLARIAEDEAIWTESLRWTKRDWNPFLKPGEPATLFSDHAQPLLYAIDEGPTGDAVATHAAHWGPAKVRAECEAKRRIVELFEEHRSRRDAYRSPRARAAEDEMATHDRRAQEARSRVAEDTLRALAAVYASHGDYREEWRP